MKLKNSSYEMTYNAKKVSPCYIKGVQKGSIAEDMGIKKGYKLVSINGEKIKDILDYKFLVDDEYLEIVFENLDGEEECYELEKEAYEDLGLIFESELIDKPMNCHNNCIFCFMNQLPKNVRDTLIFKDDDYRLSFFSGNYITMTNMKEEDVDRIIRYRLSPINISIHATDEKVRCMMLNNRFAGKIIHYMDKLYNAGIHMNTQIVLCKNINDGEILHKTIEDLSKYMPYVRCIGIVPVGLTKHRDNLYPLEELTKDDCINIIEDISKFQKKFKKKYGENVVYLADEFYLKAGVKLPDYDEYGEFENIENGIGMMANFEHEFNIEFDKLKAKLEKENKENEKIKEKEKNEESFVLDKVDNTCKKHIWLLTGKITEEYFKEKSRVLMELFPNLEINVRAIINNFFGEKITVTGLITGRDIISQIKDIKDEEIICFPNICLKEDKDIFLDDTSLDDIKKVHKNIRTYNSDAKSFIANIYKLSK